MRDAQPEIDEVTVAVDHFVDMLNEDGDAFSSATSSRMLREKSRQRICRTRRRTPPR
jgi:hypothetical protein